MTMTQGLSEQSMAEWAAFARVAGSDVSRPLDLELLNHFLIGVHLRGEEISAHELKMLVDRLEVSPELALELVSFVAPALGLLEAYDRARSDDDDDGFEGDLVGDDEVAPGILVI
ncbi:MAG: hypothetical protein M3378_09115 [Actinomycetota bacterium]|nr:hypothetical protein [Actinomycetota bacterium]